MLSMLVNLAWVVFQEMIQWVPGLFEIIQADPALSTLLLNTAIMAIFAIIALVALIRGYVALTTSNVPLEEDAGEVTEPLQQRSTSSGA